jgi:hypothetical protein
MPCGKIVGGLGLNSQLEMPVQTRKQKFMAAFTVAEKEAAEALLALRLAVEPVAAPQRPERPRRSVAKYER